MTEEHRQRLDEMEAYMSTTMDMVQKTMSDLELLEESINDMQNMDIVRQVTEE